VSWILSIMIIFPYFIYLFVLVAPFLGFLSVAVFVFALILSDRDAFGVSSYLLTLNPAHYIYYVGLFLFLYFFSIYRFYKRRYLFDNKIKKIVFLANVICFYTFLGCLVKSASVLNGLSTILYNGVVVCAIWPLLYFNKKHDKYLISFVLVQMLLSMLVLFVPYFSFIDGFIYKQLEGAYVVDMDGLNYTIPDGAFDKGTVGKYGVFHNPNALGFYSAAAMAFAYYGWTMGGRWKFISILLLCMGGVGWFNSLTRGPVLFLMLGFVFIYFISCFASKNKISLILFILGLVGLSVFILTYSNYLEYFFPSVGNASVDYRLSGYSDGFFAIESSPLFGIDRTQPQWLDLDRPHFLSLYFASEYGVLVGIAISILVFVGGFQCVLRACKLVIRNPNNRSMRNKNFFAILLISLCFGIAVSDNVTSPMLFWFCFMEAQMLVFQQPKFVKSFQNRMG